MATRAGRKFRMRGMQWRKHSEAVPERVRVNRRGRPLVLLSFLLPLSARALSWKRSGLRVVGETLSRLPGVCVWLYLAGQLCCLFGGLWRTHSQKNCTHHWGLVKVCLPPWVPGFSQSSSSSEAQTDRCWRAESTEGPASFHCQSLTNYFHSGD